MHFSMYVKTNQHVFGHYFTMLVREAVGLCHVQCAMHAGMAHQLQPCRWLGQQHKPGRDSMLLCSHACYQQAV